MAHVAGYTVANDYAIRDYLENWYRPNLRVKNRDGGTVLGPWFVDAADVGAPPQLDAAHLVNGALTQQGNTARPDLRCSVPDRVPERLHDARARRRDPDGHARRRGRRQGRRRGRHARSTASAASSTRSSTTPTSASAVTRRKNDMRIQHLIAGRAGRERATTSRPSTRRRRRCWPKSREAARPKSTAAVAAAKAAFPAWAARPATERARLMHQLGDLITRQVPELSETETRDTGQVIAPDAQATGPACRRQLPLLRRDVRARRRPHLPDRRRI